MPDRLAAADPDCDRLGHWLRGGAALLVVVVAVFPEAVLGGRVFFERDVHLAWLAHAAAFVSALREGAGPVWDPHFGFGQPHLANPQTQTLYPPTWLLLAMPAWRYYTLLVVGHLCWAGLGTAALARGWGASRAAAWTAGALVMVSGPMLSLVNVWHQLCGAAWVPWVGWAAERVASRPTAARAVVLGVVLALQVVAGSGEMCLLAGLLAAGAVVGGVARAPDRRARLARCGAALGALSLGLALSSPQWLPTLELTRGSMRGRLPESSRTLWSVHPAHLLQALVPAPLSTWTPEPAADPLLERETVEPFLHSLYLGLPALALVAAGVVSGGRRRRWLVGVFAASTLVALGRHTPAYGFVSAALPPMALFRFPVKAWVLAGFAWALLAGSGLDALLDERPRARRAALVTLGVAAACAALLAAWWPPRPPGPFPIRPGLTLTLPTAVAIVLAGLAMRSERARRRWAWLVAGVAVADLLLVHRPLNPTAEASLFSNRPPTVEALLGEGGGSVRVHVWDYAARPAGKTYPDRAGFFLRTPAGPATPEQSVAGLQAYLYPFVPGRFGLDGSFSKDMFGLYPAPLHDLTLLVRDAEQTPAFDTLLALGGVDDVVALHDEGLAHYPLVARFPGYFREPIRIRRVPAPRPRAYAVGRARALDGSPAYAALLRNEIDPASEILLPRPPVLDAGSGFSGEVRILDRRADRVRLESRTSAPGYAVLVESWDPSWRATLDGRDVPVLRANLAFRAVAVPAGTHRIEMTYSPESLRAGLAFAAAGVLAAGLAVARSRTARGGAPA